MRFLLLLMASFCTTISAFAQQKTDSTARAQTSVITDKAQEGMPLGMNIRTMALVATIHHYPLPHDVMALQRELQLSPEQVGKLNVIIKTLNLKKAEISQSVRLNEQTLDKIFDLRKPDDGRLIFFGNRYGLYEGEMRTAVLTACAQTAQVLTPRQNTKFEQLHKPID